MFLSAFSLYFHKFLKNFNSPISFVENLINIRYARTKEATVNIERSLKDVQHSIQQMEQEITSISQSSNQQAVLVTEFSEVIDQLNSVSRDLKVFIESMLLKAE